MLLLIQAFRTTIFFQKKKLYNTANKVILPTELVFTCLGFHTETEMKLYHKRISLLFFTNVREKKINRHEYQNHIFLLKQLLT